MEKSLEIGSCYVSWGAELQQDDQAFYGLVIRFGPFRWAFLGVGVDRQEQRHRDERQRLLRVLGNLDSLLSTRSDQGTVTTAEVRELLDRAEGPCRWDRADDAG